MASVIFENRAVATVINSLVSPHELSRVRIDTTGGTLEVNHLYDVPPRTRPGEGVDARTGPRCPQGRRVHLDRVGRRDRSVDRVGGGGRPEQPHRTDHPVGRRPARRTRARDDAGQHPPDDGVRDCVVRLSDHRSSGEPGRSRPRASLLHRAERRRRSSHDRPNVLGLDPSGDLRVPAGRPRASDGAGAISTFVRLVRLSPCTRVAGRAATRACG